MFRWFISSICLYCLANSANANDSVSAWLQQMGCEKLLASYLEEQLDSGTQHEKINAAKDLAHLYSTILSRSSEGDDAKTLQLATALLDRMPQAGTDELKIQLLRATYLTAEQILEKYRLRITDENQANFAAEQLREVADKFQILRDNLLRRSRSARNANEKLGRNIGLTTSLLAWSRYYIAWHNNDLQEARLAESLFAEILLGERASLELVSLDLKEKEYGARSILGIALCKDILDGPANPEDWFDELEDMATWSPVRLQVPMWKFFLEVDNKRWKNVLQDMLSVEGVDNNLILRLSAVHAMEHPSEQYALDVSAKAMGEFIADKQLAMISELVEIYGIRSLPPNGFIAKYIQGDIEYRKARDEALGNEPTQDPELRIKFYNIADSFSSALSARDSKSFTSLHDDCKYMEGLSLFYASEFVKAAEAFKEASTGDHSERSLWMAIVCLENVEELSVENRSLKEQMVNEYLSAWPDTKRATELLLLHTNTNNVDPQYIDDLLAVPYSDPNYEKSQRKAAKRLYEAWRNTNPSDKSVVGNRYVSVAISLMNADSEHEDDDLAMERAVVRALRLLEISLHPAVQRIVASHQAVDVLGQIENNGRYNIHQYKQEIAYRRVVAALLVEKYSEANTLVKEMILNSPDDEWTTLAARAIWDKLDKGEDESEFTYLIGSQVLRGIPNIQLSSKQYVEVSRETAKSGYDFFLQSNNEDAGKNALRIARVLLDAYPKSAEILHLNATIEFTLGDKDASLSHWRAIVSGSKRGSTGWLAAKVQVIQLVASTSHEDALKIIQQHHALYPEYGMEPYGSTLRQLHEELRVSND